MLQSQSVFAQGGRVSGGEALVLNVQEIAGAGILHKTKCWSNSLAQAASVEGMDM